MLRTPAPPRFQPGLPLARGARLWWRNALSFTFIAALIEGPAAVLQHAGPKDAERTWLALQLFYVVAGAMAEGAITFGALRDAAGQRLGPLRMLGAASERYGRLLAVSALCALLIQGGLMLLVVPGLVAMAATFVTIPVALAEPTLPIADVFRRSWELSRGRRMGLLLLCLAVVGVQLGASQGIDQLATVVHGAPPWAPRAAKAAADSLLEGLVCAAAVAVYVAFAGEPARAPAGRE